MSKTKVNNEFMNKQRLDGRTFCYRSELPFPEAANLSIKNGPAIAVNVTRVEFNTLEDVERELLEKEFGEN